MAEQTLQTISRSAPDAIFMKNRKGTYRLLDNARHLRPAFLMLALVSPGTEAPAATEAPRTIRVVLDNDYAPFVFQSDEGNLQGILVDQWQAWEKKTGIKAEIHPMDWGEAVRRMRAGEFDVIDCIVETPARRDYFAFTPAYATIEASIYFRNDISGITDLASLKGFPVAVKVGDQHVDRLQETGVTTVIPFKNNEAIIDAAQQHKISVFLVDDPSALYLLNKVGIEADFRRSAPIFRDELRRAVRKGDEALLRTVSEGFAAIEPGELKRIDEKWFGRTINRYGRYLTYASYAAAVAILLIAGLGVWNRTLSKRVLQRTAASSESEQRFRQIAESIQEVFWLIDVEKQTILFVSPAYERVYGRSSEGLYRDPRSWLEAVHPDDRERVQRAADEKGARGELDETYRVVRADGSIRWVRDQGFPIRDASGKTYRYAGIAEDITDRRRAEEERAHLLESESRARADAEAALERLGAIQSITELALARLALDDLLSELLARLRKALGGDFACVQLIDEKHDSLNIRAADGVPLNLVTPVRVPIGQAVAGRIAADGQPRIVYDLSGTDISRIEGLPPELHALLRGSMLGTPLQVEGRLIGVVSVASARPRRFVEEDLRLLQVVADRVAPAIERGRLDEAVRANREQLKALSRRLLTAQEEERRRLAVELHDELGQVLTAVKINLASLQCPAGAATAPANLRDTIASVDKAMERVRDLALDLRPSVLDDLGLAAAVRWYGDRFARTMEIDTHLSIDAVPKLSPELETACFRVAQEALTNVARHAQARNVWVDLHLVGDALDLRIRDDGVGFDARVARERAIGGASMGLLGMQERVSLAGGVYELSTGPGRGTEVKACLPLGREGRRTP
jgi:PAS domain S-box-containing protein